jgi:hypothetical protein
MDIEWIIVKISHPRRNEIFTGTDKQGQNRKFLHQNHFGVTKQIVAPVAIGLICGRSDQSVV